MTNKNISGLTAATTPLAGTELVPVWDGATKKVAVSDLTAGRTVATGALNASGNIAIAQPATDAVLTVESVLYGAGLLNLKASSAGLAAYNAIQSYNGATRTWWIGGDGVAGAVYLKNPSGYLGLGSAGTVEFNNNLVPTAAKGINFTANTPAAGMTSQLLNWYEEGTYTPVFTTAGGGQSVAYVIQAGNYTRIGKLVYFNAVLYTSSFTGGSGNIRVSLPIPKNSGNEELVNCGETLAWVTRAPEAGYISSATSFAVLLFNNGTGTTELTTSNITTSSNGNLVSISGTYTAA